MKRVFLLVLLLAVAATVLAAPPEQLRFTLLRGRASLQRSGSGNWLDLGPEPITVRFNDRLRTDVESCGELKYPDGSLFRLRSGTILTVLPRGVQMQVGDAWFQLPKRSESFQVVTPTTILGVLGTSFDVTVDRFGKTQVRVFDGLVAVKAYEDPRRRQVVLQKGMMSVIKDKGVTEERLQRFDAVQESGRAEREWQEAVRQARRFGPERPALPTLPPVRTLGGWRDLDTREAGTPAQKAVFPITASLPAAVPPAGERSALPVTSDIRRRLEYFSSLRHGRPVDKPDRPDQPDQEPVAGSAILSELDSRLIGPEGRPALPDDQLRGGLTTTFGQPFTGPLHARTAQQLRDEIFTVRNQLAGLELEMAAVETELRGTRNAVGSDASPATRNDTLLARLQHLREQQQRLRQRLADLQSRLY